jgi:hypothetical protein
MSEARPPGPPNELNLLYVLLALQMGFVSREAILRAMQAWVFARDRSVGELLQEQGALSPEQRRLLDRAVHEHFDSRGDDADSVLVSDDLPPTVADVMQDPPTADPRANLFALGSALPPGADRMRYRVLRLHARGGLGMVSVARDAELSREVALKELDATWAENETSRRRFVREAEITGGLEHPGIVPVYGLGRFADGRPYYVMRLIRGETLQQAIEKLHADKDGYTVRELLTRFVAVCNTVAYAHSRGVLHRDLKPANVMLGPYGETLVVDWGLAKVIGQSTESNGAAQPRAGGEAADHATTREGSALGTPAYMSPEQAAGRLDEQGIATDVYGLGATLYAVLTGQAPVAECEAEEVLKKVQEGDWPAPRHVKASVPRELDAVCQKALALKPAYRYPSALALATDVEHYLAGEPVGAYREPVLVRFRRWRRRHKTALAVIAATLLASLAGLTWGLVAVGRERDRGQILERRQAAILQIVDAGNLERAGHYESAVGSYREALRILEQVTAGNPTPDNQNLLACTLRDMGNMLHDHHDDAGARIVLRRAFELSREAQRAAPDMPRYREVFLDNLVRYCEILVTLGDHVAASDAALSAVGAGLEPGDGAFDASRIFSSCIQVATNDSKLSQSGRAERIRYYTDRAMDLLRRSVTKGFSDAARLKKEPRFDPLRDRSDFQQLLRQLETKPKDAMRPSVSLRE